MDTTNIIAPKNDSGKGRSGATRGLVLTLTVLIMATGLSLATASPASASVPKGYTKTWTVPERHGNTDCVVTARLELHTSKYDNRDAVRSSGWVKYNERGGADSGI